MSARICKPWTTVEQARLRERYAELGAVGYHRAFPGRTLSAIREYARRLGLKTKKGPRTPKEQPDAA